MTDEKIIEAMYAACGGHSTHDLCECGILHVTDGDAPSQEAIDEEYGVNTSRRTDVVAGGVYTLRLQGKFLVIGCDCGEALRIGRMLWDDRFYISSFFQEYARASLSSAMQDAGAAERAYKAARR